MPCEQAGIARSFGEHRDFDDDFGEAIIEVFAKTLRRNHRVQILMRCAHDPRIDRDCLASADPLDHAFL